MLLNEELIAIAQVPDYIRIPPAACEFLK